MSERHLTKTCARNGDGDAPNVHSDECTTGLPPQCNERHIQSADRHHLAFECTEHYVHGRHLQSADCANGDQRHLVSADLYNVDERHVRPGDCTNGDERRVRSADFTNGDQRHLQSADSTSSVVEEGEPVGPGDTLVRAKPFVYAIQPQFRTKICDYCLTL